MLPLDQVQVPALDRGFLFGDAVYEAMRLYSGRVFLARDHFARLAQSLSELRIVTDVGRLEQRMHETIAHSGAKEGLIYLQVTRGAGPRRSHAFPVPSVVPNELIWVDASTDADPHRARREAGVAVVTFPDWRWARRDIKSTNLLGNCLAAEHARQANAFEAILVDPAGQVHEGSHTSLFAVRGGRLLTCPTGPEILPGCTRAFVLELARRAGIGIELSPLRQEDLGRVDELFLTGTTTEVLGIVQVDGASVGTGRVGPITRQLADEYRLAVHQWLTSSTAVT
jgi:D-alanine transaminase